MKKLTALILALTCLLTALPFTVSAAALDDNVYEAAGYMDKKEFLETYSYQGSVAPKQGSYVGTGSSFTKNGTEYTVLVRGDISGDGQISSADYIAIKKYLSGRNLEGLLFDAADVTADGKINSADYLKEKKYFKGQGHIWNQDLYVGERFVCFRVWNFVEGHLSSASQLRSKLPNLKNAGVNTINLGIGWNVIEKEPGVYNWDILDEQIDVIVNEMGMNVSISPWLGRTEDDTLLNADEDFMMNDDGTRQGMGWNNGLKIIAFSSQNAIEKASDFYAEVVKHCDAKYGRKILFYQPTFGWGAEAEYSSTYGIYNNKLGRQQWIDYLKDKYGTIEKFNQTFETSYRSFELVFPQSVDITNKICYEFEAFRHKLLKNFLEILADKQKAILPDSRICYQFANLANPMTGTLAFKDLTEKADIVVLDPAPNENHASTMNFMRSLLPKTTEYVSEIDNPGRATDPSQIYTQFDESFEHGAKYVWTANWGLPDENVLGHKDTILAIKDKWLSDTPREVFTIDDTTPVYDLRLSAYSRNGFMSMLKDCAYSLEEDFLRPDYDFTNKVHSFPEDFSANFGYRNWRCYGEKTTTGKLIAMSFNRYWFSSAAYIGQGGIVHSDDSINPALSYVPDTDTKISVHVCFVPLKNHETDKQDLKIRLNNDVIYAFDGENGVAPGDRIIFDFEIDLKAADKLAFVTYTGGGYATISVDVTPLD